MSLRWAISASVMARCPASKQRKTASPLASDWLNKGSAGSAGWGVAGEAGIPTVGFGPSTERLAHTIDEYIEIDQLVGATRGFYGIMQSVCGAKG